MNKVSNSNGDWRNFERIIGQAITDNPGKNVSVTINPVYAAGGTSGRPIAFNVAFSIDGVAKSVNQPRIPND